MVEGLGADKLVFGEFGEGWSEALASKHAGAPGNSRVETCVLNPETRSVRWKKTTVCGRCSSIVGGPYGSIRNGQNGLFWSDYR